jgi:dimethylargininase
MLIALTRDVSPDIGRCELTHLQRQPIDVNLAMTQHRHYEDCLARFGYEVRRLHADPGLPDAVFIEDTCVVLPELAVITRPGADSRRPETRGVAEAMQPFRTLRYIEPPATLDGGDVLRIGKSVFVGLTNRTGAAAIEQLRRMLDPYGYSVSPVRVTGCLHLKSAVTAVSEDTVLVNPTRVDSGVYRDFTRIGVDPSEPAGANALLARGVVVYPTSYPRTRERLERRAIGVEPVDMSELSKAEGGVTCCSLLFEAD